MSIEAAYEKEIANKIKGEIEAFVESAFAGVSRLKIDPQFIEIQQKATRVVYEMYYSNQEALKSIKTITANDSCERFDKFLELNNGKCLRQHITGLYCILMTIVSMVDDTGSHSCVVHVTSSGRIKHEEKIHRIRSLVSNDQFAPAFVLIGFPLVETLYKFYCDRFERKAYSKRRRFVYNIPRSVRERENLVLAMQQLYNIQSNLRLWN